MLECLKIIEWKLVDMLSTPILVRKINNAKYEGYVKKKFNEETNNRYTSYQSNS